MPLVHASKWLSGSDQTSLNVTSDWSQVIAISTSRESSIINLISITSGSGSTIG